MSTIKKVIEVLASSPISFEDAVQRALDEASRTVKGIKSVYIKDQNCRVRDNKITAYRITAKITFEVMAKDKKTASGLSDAELQQPIAEGGGPDYSHVDLQAAPELPRAVEPGGSATEPESGGGYSG